MRIENRNNIVQWQGVKSGGNDTQNVHKPAEALYTMGNFGPE
jgi:hypothetical protein